MNAITFSIVICNYNYGEFIGEAIESCLAQDYPAELFDIIVVDDGSTDRSREVIRGFAGDGRIRAIYQPNQGQLAAFAAGAACATGVLVCFLDSDDLFVPEKLQRTAAHVASLMPLPDHFFLCHDAYIHDQVNDMRLEKTWFQTIGLGRLGEVLHLSNVNQQFPFSIPCGQVHSRALIQRICAALPTQDWKQAADSVIAHCALLSAETVHYLHEPLAIYRVHSSNSFAGVKDGRYVPQPVWLGRWPKTIKSLETYVDTLALDLRQRSERLAYLKRLERLVRTTSAVHRFTEPLVSFVVTAAASDSHLQETLAAIAGQTHAKSETVLVSEESGQIGRLAPAALPENLKLCRVAPGTSLAQYYRAGFRQARGDYLVFVGAGDMPDPVFAERHLYVHRYVALSMVTSADIRIVNDAGVMVYSGVYNASGAWPQPLQYIPPHAAALRDWIFPPLPANVIRNSRFLDLLFDCDGANLGNCGGHSAWLLLHYAHALGGSTRINECLLSYRVPDAAAATYAHLMEPPGDGCAAATPDYEAGAELMFDIFCRAHALFNAYYPGAWQAQFIAWLKNRNSPGLPERLKRVAERAGAPAAGALLG